MVPTYATYTFIRLIFIRCHKRYSVRNSDPKACSIDCRPLRQWRKPEVVKLWTQVHTVVKAEPAPSAPQGRSAALKLAMARPSEPTTPADSGVAGQSAANADSKTERAGVPARPGADGLADAQAASGLPAPEDVEMAPGLPDPVLSPRAGGSGSLLDLLLSDEDPPAADPEAEVGISATAAADAQPSLPKEQGVWTHERELPLWLVFGFEEGRVQAEAEAAERAARAASAQAQLGTVYPSRTLPSYLLPHPVPTTNMTDGSRADPMHLFIIALFHVHSAYNQCLPRCSIAAVAAVRAHRGRRVRDVRRGSRGAARLAQLRPLQQARWLFGIFGAIHGLNMILQWSARPQWARRHFMRPTIRGLSHPSAPHPPSCRRWYHGTCVGLDADRLQELEGRPWQCTACKAAGR